MNPRVRKVVPLPDYRLFVEFTNNEQGVYNCEPLLDFGVFRELKDKSYFDRVRARDGAVAWPHEQDICPDTLYLDSMKYAEPVQIHASKSDLR
uniref:DUF2442 domain-containing protein n=1 Tax=Candidatus Kentrum sp. DK TaxID=2126562 RepID=A0A450T784_9GAMM|nr:MAG: Protein of unknown function (DUF2442) [Candidatus Kentron sp. DK]